jgi:uncharacterized protein YycO
MKTTRRPTNRVARFEALEGRQMMSANLGLELHGWAAGYTAHAEPAVHAAPMSVPIVEQSDGIFDPPGVVTWKLRHEQRKFESAQRIGSNELRPGDMILCNGEGGVFSMRSAIKGVSASKFTHAALYVGNGQVIDATDCYGVKQRSLNEVMGTQTEVYVLRNARLTDAQRTAVVEAAQKFVGGSYSKGGCGGAATFGHKPGKDTHDRDKMCAEVVWDAYFNALGGTRVTSGNLPAPGDLGRSDYFAVVGMLKGTHYDAGHASGAW